MRIEPDIGLRELFEPFAVRAAATPRLSGHWIVILVPTLIADGVVVCAIFGWLLM